MIISITKETHIMGKMTIQTQITFGTTHILDKEVVENTLKEVQEAVASNQLPDGKAKVFAKLTLEAYEKDGLEGFVGALVQYGVREQIQTLVTTYVPCEKEPEIIKVTPVRVQLLETKHSNKGE